MFTIYSFALLIPTVFFLRHQVKILLSHFLAEFGDVDNLIEVSDAMVIDHSDDLEMSDVSIHGLFGVVGFACDGLSLFRSIFDIDGHPDQLAVVDVDAL